MAANAYALDPAWHAEYVRLTSLTDLYDSSTVQVFDTSDINDGMHCLELGAGTGTIAEDLARRVGPTGRVMAVDLDTRFLAHLDHPGLEIQKADVRQLDWAAHRFDVVHARLLLEHLPERETILDGMITALKPGGILIVEDFDLSQEHVTHPHSPTHAGVLAALRDFLTSVGYDPHWARSLPQRLRLSGLHNVSSSIHAPQVWADPHQGVPAYELLIDQLAPALTAQGWTTSEEIDAFHTLCHSGHTIMWMPMVTASGRAPA